MWKVCDCKDQLLPLSVAVPVSDCREFKPLWRFALTLFPSLFPSLPFPSLHLPFSNHVTLSFSASV